MNKLVAMVIAAELFRDEEYLVPKELLEKSGHKVLTVSTTLDYAQGKLGAKVKPDCLLRDLSVARADALVFVGGGGSSQYFNDLSAHRLARDFYKQGKVVGAICIAPVILANAGLLRGKKATVFPDGAADLLKGGAIYTGEPVVTDGLIITGNGPTAAAAFGEELARLLG